MKVLLAIAATVAAMLVAVPAQAQPSATADQSCNIYGGLPPGPPAHNAGTVSVNPSPNANAGTVTVYVPGPCEAPGFNK